MSRQKNLKIAQGLTTSDVKLIIQQEIKAKKTPFSQKPLVIIITITAALIGAATGVYNLIRTINEDKPKCLISKTGFVMGEPNKSQTIMIFSGSIINEGKRPLYRKQIEASLITGDIKTPIFSEIMPERFTGDNDNAEITFTNKKDLLRVDKIAPTEVESGDIMFYSNKPLSFFKSYAFITLQLIFTDIKDRKFKFQFEIDLTEKREFQKKQMIPNSSLLIIPKKDTTVYSDTSRYR